MLAKLSMEQLDEYEEVFSFYDTDNNGTICVKELEVCFQFFRKRINRKGKNNILRNNYIFTFFFSKLSYKVAKTNLFFFEIIIILPFSW